MNFYELWEEFTKEGVNDISFIEAFLNKTKLSEDVFLFGDDDEMFQLCSFFSRYDINLLINNIDSKYLSIIEPSLVVQFSNFSFAVDRLINVLYEKDDSMNFDEIGLELLGERASVAMKKYGENHAKLANIFSLVTLSATKPTVVSLTNFGRFCVMLDARYKYKLLRILALREPLIKNIIYRAKQGLCKYKIEVACLSNSTMIRRRSNVKSLLEMVLTNTNYEYLLNNIEW